MTPWRFAWVLLVMAAVAAWQATVIPESAIQMTVGASAVPIAVVSLLLALGLLYAVSAWRGKQADEGLEEGQTPLAGSTKRLLTLLGGGLAFMIGLPWLGFVIPATACGMCVASSFDAPFSLKSLLICGAIALVFWVLFSQILGVGLGPASPFGV
ncbi:MAG: tripartite tricarboxylate transporter TctB family protein [Brachymonas sp.]|nr:tripartite tricarboxylate transporter TctB family protein [Brachymonas sp.]NJS36209.1 tripartite tricarboxylate transporter TctB family protein [Brachymonas sp.]